MWHGVILQDAGISEDHVGMLKLSGLVHKGQLAETTKLSKSFVNGGFSVLTFLAVFPRYLGMKLLYQKQQSWDNWGSIISRIPAVNECFIASQHLVTQSPCLYPSEDLQLDGVCLLVVPLLLADQSLNSCIIKGCITWLLSSVKRTVVILAFLNRKWD